MLDATHSNKDQIERKFVLKCIKALYLINLENEASKSTLERYYILLKLRIWFDMCLVFIYSLHENCK